MKKLSLLFLISLLVIASCSTGKVQNVSRPSVVQKQTTMKYAVNGQDLVDASLYCNPVIKIMNDIELDENVVFTDDVEINMNGKTIRFNGTGGYAFTFESPEASVHDGTIITKAGGVQIGKGSDYFTMENVRIEARGTSISVAGPSVVKLYECTLTTRASAPATATVEIADMASDTVSAPFVNINVCELTNKSSSCVISNNKLGDKRPVLKIDNSNLTTENFVEGNLQTFSIVTVMHTDTTISGSCVLQGPKSTKYYFMTTSEREDIPSTGECRVPFLFGTKTYFREVGGETATRPNSIPWGDVRKMAMENNLFLLVFMAGDGSVFNPGGADPDKWGDSCLLVFPNGETMLIDGGMPLFGTHLVDSLKKIGIEQLDYLMLSHNHNDHWGGIFDYNGNAGAWSTFKPSVFFTNNLWGNNEGVWKNVSSYSKKYKTEIVTVKEGDTYDFGGVKMEILWPLMESNYTLQPGDAAEKVNSSSIVAQFTYGSIKALFTGDLYTKAERELIEAKDVQSTVLKICHHGRTSSSSPEFTKAVSAEVGVATGHTIFSDDGYGAINKTNNVIASFAAAGTEIYSDYLNGFILISISADEWNIRTSGK